MSKARPATARAPAPAMFLPAALVTWTGPVVVADALGPTGVAVPDGTDGAGTDGASDETVPAGAEGATGDTLMMGMVAVPGVVTG